MDSAQQGGGVRGRDLIGGRRVDTGHRLGEGAGPEHTLLLQGKERKAKSPTNTRVGVQVPPLPPQGQDLGLVEEGIQRRAGALSVVMWRRYKGVGMWIKRRLIKADLLGYLKEQLSLPGEWA